MPFSLKNNHCTRCQLVRAPGFCDVKLKMMAGGHLIVSGEYGEEPVFWDIRWCGQQTWPLWKRKANRIPPRILENFTYSAEKDTEKNKIMTAQSPFMEPRQSAAPLNTFDAIYEKVPRNADGLSSFPRAAPNPRRSKR